MALYKF